MSDKKKHVLVAPLDWGFGHATRCIPIIRLLISKEYKVSIASSGNAVKILRKEFPDLNFFLLPAYGAIYSRYLPFMIHIFLQLPKFLLAIGRERKVVEQIIKENEIDLIISDNRYGCWASNVRSVFICHQINIIMPLGLRWVSPILNYFNHQWILKFDQCWIPDDPIKSLSGKLSNPCLPNAIHIGLLSRFRKTAGNDIVYRLAIVHSGPEPQRSVLEQIIRKQLDGTALKTIFVRGILNGMDEMKMDGNVTFINHLKSDQLQHVIEESEIVLCRSGYSSIMDLAVLEKKVILIPTPGQTEQEYLGKSLMKKKIALSYPQKNFDLAKALSEIKNYSGFEGWSSQPNLLEEAIDKKLE